MCAQTRTHQIPLSEEEKKWMKIIRNLAVKMALGEGGRGHNAEKKATKIEEMCVKFEAWKDMATQHNTQIICVPKYYHHALCMQWHHAMWYKCYQICTNTKKPSTTMTTTAATAAKKAEKKEAKRRGERAHHSVEWKKTWQKYEVAVEFTTNMWTGQNECSFCVRVLRFCFIECRL